MVWPRDCFGQWNVSGCVIKPQIHLHGLPLVLHSGNLAKEELFLGSCCPISLGPAVNTGGMNLEPNPQREAEPPTRALPTHARLQSAYRPICMRINVRDEPRVWDALLYGIVMAIAD